MAHAGTAMAGTSRTLAYIANFAGDSRDRRAGDHPRPLHRPPHLFVTGEAIGTPPDAPVPLSFSGLVEKDRTLSAAEKTKTVEKLQQSIEQRLGVKMAASDIRVCMKLKDRQPGLIPQRNVPRPWVTTGSVILRFQRRATAAEVLRAHATDSPSPHLLLNRAGAPCTVRIEGRPHLEETAIPAHTLWLTSDTFVGLSLSSTRNLFQSLLTQIYDSAPVTEGVAEEGLWDAAQAAWQEYDSLAIPQVTHPDGPHVRPPPQTLLALLEIRTLSKVATESPSVLLELTSPQLVTCALELLQDAALILPYGDVDLTVTVSQDKLTAQLPGASVVQDGFYNWAVRVDNITPGVTEGLTLPQPQQLGEAICTRLQQQLAESRPWRDRAHSLHNRMVDVGLSPTDFDWSPALSALGQSGGSVLSSVTLRDEIPVARMAVSFSSPIPVLLAATFPAISVPMVAADGDPRSLVAFSPHSGESGALVPRDDSPAAPPGHRKRSRPAALRTPRPQRLYYPTFSLTVHPQSVLFGPETRNRRSLPEFWPAALRRLTAFARRSASDEGRRRRRRRQRPEEEVEDPQQQPPAQDPPNTQEDEDMQETRSSSSSEDGRQRRTPPEDGTTDSRQRQRLQGSPDPPQGTRASSALGSLELSDHDPDATATPRAGQRDKRSASEQRTDRELQAQDLLHALRVSSPTSQQRLAAEVSRLLAAGDESTSPAARTGSPPGAGGERPTKSQRSDRDPAVPEDRALMDTESSMAP